TSMSSPHVAGGVALLLEARPELGAHDVRDVLQNSAEPRDWRGDPELGLPDNVHRQGAGMLDVPGAGLADAGIVPGKLALGATEEAGTETITITNAGASEASYALGHEAAVGAHWDSFVPDFNCAAAEVSFSSDSFSFGAAETTE